MLESICLVETTQEEKPEQDLKWKSSYQHSCRKIFNSVSVRGTVLCSCFLHICSSIKALLLVALLLLTIYLPVTRLNTYFNIMWWIVILSYCIHFIKGQRNVKKKKNAQSHTALNYETLVFLPAFHFTILFITLIPQLILYQYLKISFFVVNCFNWTIQLCLVINKCWA